LDKDNSRRSRESISGANFRLFENFFKDPKHYKFRPDLDLPRVATKKYARAKQLLPESWIPKEPFGPQHVPVARLLRKSKCMSKTTGGLSCTRTHSHDREVINCAA
jgi:hypothetical protein